MVRARFGSGARRFVCDGFVGRGETGGEEFREGVDFCALGEGEADTELRAAGLGLSNSVVLDRLERGGEPGFGAEAEFEFATTSSAFG